MFTWLNLDFYQCWRKICKQIYFPIENAPKKLCYNNRMDQRGRSFYSEVLFSIYIEYITTMNSNVFVVFRLVCATIRTARPTSSWSIPRTRLETWNRTESSRRPSRSTRPSPSARRASMMTLSSTTSSPVKRKGTGWVKVSTTSDWRKIANKLTFLSWNANVIFPIWC